MGNGGGGTGGGTGASFSGKVKAGLQPVSGATVQLYAAGGAGYGSAGTALLSSALTTDSAGGFTVPAGYTCSERFDAGLSDCERRQSGSERGGEQLVAGVDDCVGRLRQCCLGRDGGGE